MAAASGAIISGTKAFFLAGLSITIFRMWPCRSLRTRPSTTALSFMAFPPADAPRLGNLDYVRHSRQ